MIATPLLPHHPGTSYTPASEEGPAVSMGKKDNLMKGEQYIDNSSLSPHHTYSQSLGHQGEIYSARENAN